MFIRKQGIFTELRIFPYLKKEDLHLELLDRVRLLAVNNAGGDHPWKNMDDETLLKSAGLYTMDYDLDKPGFNLAAALLLGRDEVIHSICPAYRTDALLRRENVDRYDDRDVVDTNLIDSYERLFAFAQKHLPDKFFVEDSFRKSIRNIIVREMISNTLMHREFTSSFQAKFIIERNRMFVENANRAPAQKIITLENLELKPKNPTIASFFRNIGYADQLGSGVRKMFLYSKPYGGADPTFSEDDVFRITVSLNDYVSEPQNEEVNNRVNNEVNNRVNNKFSEIQQKIINVLREKPTITQREMSKCISISLVHINKNMRALQKMGAVSRVGNNKQGSWIVNEEKEKS
jgi:ATP-dependent DNA helicase RecG